MRRIHEAKAKRIILDTKMIPPKSCCLLQVLSGIFLKWTEVATLVSDVGLGQQQHWRKSKTSSASWKPPSAEKPLPLGTSYGEGPQPVCLTNPVPRAWRRRQQRAPPTADDDNGSAGGELSAERAEAPDIQRKRTTRRLPHSGMACRPSSGLVTRGDGRDDGKQHICA